MTANRYIRSSVNPRGNALVGREASVEHPAIRILSSRRIMAISTVRPDGWPQTTVVGYANRGFDIYFLIFRASQKLANIEKDDRISIAIAEEPKELGELQAIYAGAHVSEISDPKGREDAWRLLMERHANLAGFQIPDAGEAAFMHARCKYVSMLDYTQGPGHREQLIIDEQGTVVDAGTEKDEWTLAGHNATKGKATTATVKGYCEDIENRTIKNDAFRRVLYTGKNIQLVLMTLQAGEEIGEEVHQDRDQFFRIEDGEGAVFINGAENAVSDNFAVIVPAGARHNVRNTGAGPLRLYTLYAPPEHLDGLIENSRADAMAIHEEWDGKTTE
jgi:mannose-6-phosphate isomerase-like protein (cupin superfamily)